MRVSLFADRVIVVHPEDEYGMCFMITGHYLDKVPTVDGLHVDKYLTGLSGWCVHTVFMPEEKRK